MLLLFFNFIFVIIHITQWGIICAQKNLRDKCDSDNHISNSTGLLHKNFSWMIKFRFLCINYTLITFLSYLNKIIFRTKLNRGSTLEKSRLFWRINSPSQKTKVEKSISKIFVKNSIFFKQDTLCSDWLSSLWTFVSFSMSHLLTSVLMSKWAARIRYWEFHLM